MNITDYIVERELPGVEKLQLARKRNIKLYIKTTDVEKRMLQRVPNKKRDIKILKARANGRTLEEIGKDMNLTRERIRAIEDDACKNAFQVVLSDVRYLEDLDGLAKKNEKKMQKMLENISLTDFAEKVGLPYQTLINIRHGTYGGNSGETHLTGIYLYMICKALDVPMEKIIGKKTQLPSEVIV